MSSPAWELAGVGPFAFLRYAGCPLHGESVALVRGRLVGRCWACVGEATRAELELSLAELGGRARALSGRPAS